MKYIRSDYKINRNKEIYEDYQNSDTSFNKLAQKYGLSPQRIQSIVSDFKKKNLEASLSIPVCALPGDRVAISRNIGGRWRLIGVGTLRE